MVDRNAQASPRGPVALRLDRWSMGALAIAALVLAPIVAVVWLAATPVENVWPHLVATTLPRYLGNTLVLMASVGLAARWWAPGPPGWSRCTAFRACGGCNGCCCCRWRCPAYVGAYALVDFLEYAGPVQGALRELFGLAERARLLVSRDPLARGGHRGADGGALPVRLPAVARRLPRAVGLQLRGGAGAGGGALRPLLARGPAAGAAGDRGGHGHRDDGDGQRLRHRRLFRGADADHGHLQRLAAGLRTWAARRRWPA